MKCAASRGSHLWETSPPPPPAARHKQQERRTEALYCTEVGIVRADSTVPTASLGIHDWKELLGHLKCCSIHRH